MDTLVLLLLIVLLIVGWASEDDTMGIGRLVVLAILGSMAYPLDYVAGALGVKRVAAAQISD